MNNIVVKVQVLQSMDILDNILPATMIVSNHVDVSSEEDEEVWHVH